MARSGKTASSWRAWGRLLLSSKIDAATSYNLRGDVALVGGQTIPIANMGYWDQRDPKDPNAIEGAVCALFDMVCSGAEITTEDHVLDAGCGFGTNAVRCLQTFQPRRVTGINLSSVQLKIAQQHAAKSGFADRIALIESDATKLPLHQRCIDKIVSVEAAFHFDTRKDFFEEAFRVLRPGGIISLVDLLPLPARNWSQRLMLKILRRTHAIPSSNVYGVKKYLDQATAAGFEILEAESILERVYTPFRKWVLGKPFRQIAAYHPLFTLTSTAFLAYPWDYIRLRARKP